jgi:hypothetical protein
MYLCTSSRFTAVDNSGQRARYPKMTKNKWRKLYDEMMLAIKKKQYPYMVKLLQKNGHLGDLKGVSKLYRDSGIFRYVCIYNIITKPS